MRPVSRIWIRCNLIERIVDDDVVRTMIKETKQENGKCFETFRLINEAVAKKEILEYITFYFLH